MIEHLQYLSLGITSSEIANYITALSTLALVFVTCILVWITKRLIDVSSSPQVVAIIKPARWSRIHFDIELENTGSATAFDIDVQYTPPLFTDQNSGNLARAPFTAVTVLKPGQVLTSYLGDAVTYLDQKYLIDVSWSRKPGRKCKRQSLKYEIDLSFYEDTGILGDGNGDPAIAAYRELEKIRKALETMVKRV